MSVTLRKCTPNSLSRGVKKNLLFVYDLQELRKTNPNIMRRITNKTKPATAFTRLIIDIQQIIYIIQNRDQDNIVNDPILNHHLENGESPNFRIFRSSPWSYRSKQLFRIFKSNFTL